jgi:Zn-dependent protease
MFSLQSFLLTIFAILVAIDVHECAHAWAANTLGDATARYMGRLSLNPVRHLDPIGSIMMLVSSFTGFGIGWGKPVPVNGARLRYGPRVGMALVAIAGPVSNLLTAAILALPLRLGVAMPYAVYLVLYAIARVNVVIAVFNLIPIPPLDGFGVLMGILHAVRTPTTSKVANALMHVEAQGPMLLLGLLLLDWVLPFSILNAILGEPVNFLWKIVGG